MLGLAALWAFIFALLHLVWAFGWYLGLDAEMAEKAFRQKWFLVYDLIAFFLCVAAMLTALAFRQKHRCFLISFIGRSCALVLVIRAVFGLIKTIYLLLNGKDFAVAVSLWDLWFCGGAILFLVSVRQFNKQKNQEYFQEKSERLNG